MRRVLLITGVVLLALAGCKKPESVPEAVGPDPVPPGQAAAPALAANDAFRMAFGSAPPAARKVEGENGGDFSYSPGKLVPVADGLVALVSTATNAQDCHACSGALAIHYLRREGSAWTLAGSWPEITPGQGFGAAPDWSVRADLAPGVWIAVEAGWTGQGYTCGSVDLIELTPAGAVMRGENLPTHYDNAGAVMDETPAEEEDGTLSRTSDGKFRVTVSGSKTGTVDYELVGGRLVRRGPSVITDC